MSKLFVPLEQVKKGLNVPLSDASKDQDISGFLLSAQNQAEKYCRREFDGQKLRTEYISGTHAHSLILKHYPIRSISEVNIDPSQIFSAATAIDSSAYWVNADRGEISLITSNIPQLLFQVNWPEGQENIRIKYYGGWVSETTVVASAVKTSTHTIADNLLTYGQNFYALLKTTGQFTAGGAGVLITGLDENGTSITERIVPNITDATLSKSTLSYSMNLFSKITAVDSSALTGAGSLSLTAVSMPADLRGAIVNMVGYLYKMDQQSRIGIRSRSTQGESETIDDGELPKVVTQVLDLYKNWNV
jgi:hypothetical protein